VQAQQLTYYIQETHQVAQVVRAHQLVVVSIPDCRSYLAILRKRGSSDIDRKHILSEVQCSEVRYFRISNTEFKLKHEAGSIFE
jgi:hypothetical protein